MTDASWSAHPLFDGYEASTDGRVRSVTRSVPNRWGGSHLVQGRELATFVRKSGYLGGNLSVAGRRLNFEVHVFVCQTFHGLRPDDDLEVRHLNGDKQDNRPANLAWGTKSENMLDKVAHGVHHEAIKTHCPAGHAYDEANTYRSPGRPNKRQCRKCMAIREAMRPPGRRR